MHEHESLIPFVRLFRWVWPGWWFYRWLCSRWPGHNCERQPVTCWLEWCFSVPTWVWLDV